MKKIAFIAFFLLTFCIADSQEAETKKEFNPTDEVVHDNKRYRVWNNYLTFGGMPGASINSNIPTSQFAGALDFNFHIKRQYFQSGILMSGNVFGDYNNTQAHICWGKRIEKTRYHFAAYGGVEYSLFYFWAKDSVPQKFLFPARSAVGAYAAVQNIWKFKYDVGIGLTLYGSYNTSRYLYGLRMEVYFSNAYRGEKGRRKNVGDAN